MQALTTSISPSGIPTAVVQKIPVPNPSASEALVQVKAVALNPIDALYVSKPISLNPTRTVGSDFAGVVTAVGEDVLAVKVGDRVAGFLQGACSSNDRPGAFAEYAVCPADLLFGIPSSASFEEGSTLPLAALTSAQALYQRMGLPAPFHSETLPPPAAHKSGSPAILIYGASTSIGMYAVQLALLSKAPSGQPYRVYTTSSPSNFSLLQSLGVTGVVSYRDSDWPQQIMTMSEGGVAAAYDCISEGSTTGRISECFVKEDTGAEKVVAVIRAAAWDKALVRSDVVPKYGAVWSGLGVEIGYNGAIIPANPTSRRFSQEFFSFLSSDKTTFKIKPNNIRLMPGGIQQMVNDGFELLGSGTVGNRDGFKNRSQEWMKPISGEKLVYHILE